MFNIDFAKIWEQLSSSPLILNEVGQFETRNPLLFSSGLFVFLFVGFYAIYSLTLRHKTLRLAWVTAFSLFFYYKCAGIFWLLHVVIVVVDYNLARWMEAARSGRERKWFLFLSLCVNLGMLVYFKYNWDSQLWCELTGKPFDVTKLFLPAGISFFTFQSLSYTIDIYRGEIKALDSMLDYAFFVTFFPQMVAGPIVRARDFLPQIDRVPQLSQSDFGRGVFLICTGLFKKGVISDYISVNFVQRVFEQPQVYTGVENLMGVYGYALQIYCDFSGYSDMAIGLALLMGFHFPINFDSPYKSLSVTEFWRRWHISLSSWLRDYLYVPLGGNRHGTWMTYRNLMLTMLLGGLWHGAALRFIIWGGLHGAALAVERLVKSYFPGEVRPWRKVLGGLLTFHFVCFCWVYFRAENLDVVRSMLHQIVFEFHPEVLSGFFDGYAAIVFWMLVGYALHFTPATWELGAQRAVTRLPLLLKVLCIVLVAALVMQVKSSDVQPFIYFQF